MTEKEFQEFDDAMGRLEDAKEQILRDIQWWDDRYDPISSTTAWINDCQRFSRESKERLQNIEKRIARLIADSGS